MVVRNMGEIWDVCAKIPIHLFLSLDMGDTALLPRLPTELISKAHNQRALTFLNLSSLTFGSIHCKDIKFSETVPWNVAATQQKPARSAIQENASE